MNSQLPTSEATVSEPAVALGPAIVDPRVDILGVHVSVTNPDDAMWRINDWIHHRDRQYICVSDVNALLHASKDNELRDFYNNSGLTLPDGMPLVWAGRRAGFTDIERVCGPDLLPKVLQASAHLGWRNFFLGGAEGVAQRLADSMQQRFPGLPVAGVECPPFRELSPAEKDELIGRVNDARPDIVWVGLGAPKQERWMAEFRPRLEAPVLIGVGAAFAFHVGDVRRAPRIFQRSGLEWAYRVSQEPGRLTRRYAIAVPQFLSGVAKHPPRPV
ncbi:WecB/TagA/CpsF family glycosyltransferase [Piscicoccus intestinalis]|uniref:WecB/TagA/CpsF family glycosyltransferase n=1 Tax=Piscicoccus intestinalis TaxID=746033 RepID=UPI000A456CBE|nr:WecB/TagA/CpsF family glycosyltransferase [Piscicoccus intestinalis]